MAVFGYEGFGLYVIEIGLYDGFAADAELAGFVAGFGEAGFWIADTDAGAAGCFA